MNTNVEEQREASSKGLLASLASYPQAVWVLFFGVFLNKFGTFVMPFLALYLTRKGYSTIQTSVAIGAYGAGNLVASGVGGHLADTMGRRNTIVISMFGGALAMMLLYQAESFWAILALAFLVGLTGEAYRPASSALLADLVPAGDRVTAFSAYRMAFNAGFAFGPATAGFLAEHSYYWLFVGDAASSVLFGIVALFALPRGLRAKQSETGWLVAFRAAARDGRYLRVVAASAVVTLLFNQLGSSFGLHVTRSGFPATTYGALLSLNGALVVLCELPLTMLTRRFPARNVMALGYGLVGGGLALLAICPKLAIFASSVVILTLGEMVCSPVSSAYVADLAPRDLRGRYMGVMGLAAAAMGTFGPGMGIALLGHSPAALWLSCGGLGFLAGLIILTGKD